MDNSGNKNYNSDGQQSAFGAVSAFIFDLVKILVIALVIIIPFRIFIAEPFVVSGSSMLPNFHDKDYLIVDRLSYRLHVPKRGDVIVLRYPKDTSQFFIKRIIGLPGEKIWFDQGHVFIANLQYPNGFELTETYLPNQIETFDVHTSESDAVMLGTDEYFVLGDNRTASSDSRVWGILPNNDIVGRVLLRVYPFSAFKHFTSPSY